MKIKTSFDYPPIPVRDMDWSAWDDDTLDGAPDAGPKAHRVGRGRTEAEAIADLAELWVDDFTVEQLDAMAVKAADRGDGKTWMFLQHLHTMVGA